MTKLNPVPLVTRRLNIYAATALIIAAMVPAPVAFAQIEVDIITTGTAAADTQTTANETTASEAGDAPAASNLREDRSADEAARKIVPAPGTQMQSTEGSTLTNTSGAIAAEPSLQMQENEMVLTAGETTETLAVNSGAELLKMLGLQLKKTRADEPLEMDESTTNTLFDVEAVRRLKGSDPTVVYRVVVNETPLPDPMIVPWIRQAKLLQERFDRAVEILGENRVDEGRQELMGIIADFPESDYATQARALLAKLDDLNRPVDVPVISEQAETTVTVELSPNIQIGTVIVDPQNTTGNRAMIGGRTYKVGDEIPAAAGHRVVGISETVVQIEVTQSGLTKTFDVPVRPRGATN